MSSAPSIALDGKAAAPAVEWRPDKGAQGLQDRCPTDGPFGRALCGIGRAKFYPGSNWGQKPFSMRCSACKGCMGKCFATTEFKGPIFERTGSGTNVARHLSFLPRSY